MLFSPLVARIVREALRAGMWETDIIKVFCNSIKDSSLAVPQALAAILHLSPAVEGIPVCVCAGVRVCVCVWLQPPVARLRGRVLH